jgi:deazaflavin-dependent oxidoreductase (nitroreductase family)
LYRLTGGRFGLRVPRPDRYGLMRITTTGRRSGKARSVMLAYLEDGDNIVTLAMNGWGEPEPAWWLNLLDQPNAFLSLVDGPRAVRGRAADGEERERLWARWQELDEKLDAYATMRDTTTAVVVFEPRTA